MISYYILIGFIFLISNQTIYSLKCKNSDGHDVDWFLLWSPASQKHTNQYIENFFPKCDGYVYIDSNSNEPGFTISESKSIGDADSYIGNTFKDVYENSDTYSYLQYSDEKPKPANPNRVSKSKLMKNLFKNFLDKIVSPKFAISKGTIVWNLKDNEFIWFTHSAKHFLPPFTKNQYSFPESGKKEGQNFLCLSLDISYLEKVLIHLHVMTPQVYDFRIKQNSNPDEFEQMIGSKANDLIASIKPIKDINSRFKTVIMKNKRKFYSLVQDLKIGSSLDIKIASKSRRIDFLSLWSNLDLKEFASKPFHSAKSRLQRIKSIFNSPCNLKDKLYGILDVNIKIKNDKNKIYFGKQDNSNWFVCGRKEINCFCFSDINNTSFYKNKGGGVICLMSKILKDTFQTTMAEQSNCQIG